MPDGSGNKVWEKTTLNKTMPFEQANIIDRFYYDYQDTNTIIDETEWMATENAGQLRGFSCPMAGKLMESRKMKEKPVPDNQF